MRKFIERLGVLTGVAGATRRVKVSYIIQPVFFETLTADNQATVCLGVVSFRNDVVNLHLFQRDFLTAVGATTTIFLMHLITQLLPPEITSVPTSPKAGQTPALNHSAPDNQ